MTSRAIVVDYGVGNVFSVCSALKSIGADPVLTGSLSAIRDADRLILPGVGAFARAMSQLESGGIADAIRTYVMRQRPFLGICIGMQVLLSESTEFGVTHGLGLIPGRVERIPEMNNSGSALRVPHIGWSVLEAAQPWENTPLRAIRPGTDSFYFVHSYHCKPDNAVHMLATTDYGGVSVTAAIARDNIVGLQFHPERSSANGLRLLKRFVEGRA